MESFFLLIDDYNFKNSYVKFPELTNQCRVADFVLGDTVVRYLLRADVVEFSLLPAALADHVVERRQSGQVHPSLPKRTFREIFNTSVDPLVQVAVRGQISPRMWTAGGTMRNGGATSSLKFDRQTCDEVDGTVQIDTYLTSDFDFRVRHRLLWSSGDLGVRIETSIENTGQAVLPIEMLSSFSLTGISPFVDDDAAGRLKLHRFRSAWSNEAQHTVQDFGELNLERTWAGAPTYLRYGQTGSLPVRKFHPFIAVEDAEAGVFWGATVAWHGSWQMEVQRGEDPVSLSGGLGDFEQAHWMKALAPGDTFTAPIALLATGCGDIDALCSRLVDTQKHLAHEEPPHEAELPIIFNEWCSSWGNPTHDYLLRTADRLSQTHTKYLVIDDGWAEKPAGADIQFNGDWNVSKAAFPEGIGQTAAAIRERGLIPGLWYEFEACTEGTEAFKRYDHQLQRDGRVLQVGSRHFWDFRDPWTFDYLSDKVIKLLRDNGFGYLKVDYNESIGLGCDGAESLGEGLRQHLVKVKEFFAKIRREVPGIVIENCASGGHRVEPGMVGLTSMSSSSDAHETVEIPIIAAQMHRLIPVCKNQVWAVLRPEDSHQRLYYSLAATFLGRMCISGDVVELSEDRFAIVQQAQGFYQQIQSILKCGRSKLYDHTGLSRRYPTGWQALVRESQDGESVLVVVHRFDRAASDLNIDIPVPTPSAGSWEIESAFTESLVATLSGPVLRVEGGHSFVGAAFRLVLRRDR
jgi:alpha-galactosidase